MNRFVSKLITGAAAFVTLVCVSAGAVHAAVLPSIYQYDTRELQQIYPATRDQGAYNTCWAFSAVGLAEFDLIHDDGIADKNLDLSELQLAYYTYHNEEDPLGGTYADTLKTYEYLQVGGNLNICTRALLQWQGLIPEAELPYAEADRLKAPDSSYAFGKDYAHLQNVYILNIHKQPQDVKKEIMQHGSAGVSIYAGRNYNRYDTTAFYERTGELVTTFYCPDDEKADHAVNIVGWDDDFPADSFRQQPEGNGAWLVRNSWSDQTGNDYRSYFWVSYYDRGLEDDAWILDFEPADNYDFNYQYDGCSVASKAWSTPVCANVFKVKGAANEQLKAVSLAMYNETEVPYTIKIYTNLSKRQNPRSGILAATVRGKTTYEGNYTIPLEKAVSLAKGTYYSVVVELGNKDAGIDIERTYSTEYFQSVAYINDNQSFLYRNGKWKDLAEYGALYQTGNLCIKAFTDRSGASIGKVSKLKKTAASKESVKLSWSKVSGAGGYEIYRATSRNGTYKRIATTAKTSYKDKKLKSKHTYYYKVRAYRAGESNTVSGALSSMLKTKTK